MKEHEEKANHGNLGTSCLTLSLYHDIVCQLLTRVAFK